MLAFPEAPSAAFKDAVARIAPLRSFSAVTEAHLDHLASVVVSQRYSQLASLPNCSRHTYLSDGEGVVHVKDEAFRLGSRGQTPAAQLREKLFSDIAQDLRLPHTAYAFKANALTGQPDGTISLVPQPDARTIENVFERHELESPPDHPYGIKPYLFLAHNPHLIPAYAALAVFDLWPGNYDRHEENLLTDSRPAKGQAQMLCGIDLNKFKFFETAPCAIHTPLDQKPVMERLPGHIMAPAVAATLKAIETYPLSRLEQLAARLQPLSTSWNAAAEVQHHDKRRKALRDALHRYFPKAALSQLA